MLYAYGAVRAGAEPPAPGLRGVAGRPVRLVCHEELAALVSPVPAEEFEESALRSRLEDLGWLEETARAHQRVVDAAAFPGPVLPLRLATVYRDEEGVRRMLAADRERFAESLDRVEGRVEWGVKAYATVPPEQPAARPAEPAAPVPAGPGAGREYLRRRSQARRVREDGMGRAHEVARQVHEALHGYAEASRLHRPQDARLSGERDPNVLNASYLVPSAEASGFAARVRALDASTDAARLELTGPWAPYSFVTS
nr:GvpL/GvpF family gas vesicle protein [Streptomyces sp. SID5468]